MPPVGDQGGEGSCVGWAVGYYYKTFQEKIDQRWDVQLKENQFSPSWVYNQIMYGDDEGAAISLALLLLRDRGCDTMEHFPYIHKDVYTQPDIASMDYAAHFKIRTFFRIGNDSNLVNTLKQLLAQTNSIRY